MLWFFAAGLWLLAILVTIGFAIGGRKQVAPGIRAGVGIGFVALGITGFAILSTVEI